MNQPAVILQFYNFLLQSKNRMTDIGRGLTILVLVITALLVGLHIAVAARGFYWFNDNILYTAGNGINYGERDFNQYCAYIIIAAAFELIFCVILLIDTFKIILTQKNRAFLLGITLAIEWSLMIVIALLASTASNERDLMGYRFGHSFDDLDVYYRVAVADTVINFVVKLIPWVVVFYLALKELSGIREEDVGAQQPPTTTERM